MERGCILLGATVVVVGTVGKLLMCMNWGCGIFGCSTLYGS